MDYDWHMSKFNRTNHIVVLTAESGCNFDCYQSDINSLHSMALKYNASCGEVESEDSITRVIFVFPTDANWEAFCKEFLNPARLYVGDEAE